MQNQQTQVPFEKLTAPAFINARDEKDTAYKDVTDLVSSIKAVGLLQPLVVRPNGATYEVLAGKRRYTAIALLRKSGEWPSTQAVPVVVKDLNDEDALEASFFENTARRAMHPVREYEVFTKLQATGDSIAAIADRYGITERQVEQRLALGRLHPAILKAWKAGDMNADAAQVFARMERKRQKQVYDDLVKRYGQVQAWAVKDQLHKGKAALNDSRLAFVGLDTYKAAGGTIVEDLFGRDGFVEDVELLDKLVKDKLATIKQDLVADGWAWAKLSTEFGNNGSVYGLGQVKVQPEFTPTEAAQIKKAEQQIKAIEAKGDDNFDNNDDDAIDALREQIAALTDAATLRSYTPEQKKRSGCVVFVGSHEYRIEYGKLMPKDKKTETKTAAGARDSSTVDAGADEEASGLSNALLSDLTAAQTVACIEALTQCPGLVLRLLAAALSPDRGLYRMEGLCPVRLNPEGMERYTKAADDLESDDDADDAGDEYDPNRNAFAEKLEEITEKTAPAVLAGSIGRVIDLRQHKLGGVDVSAARALINAIPGDLYLKSMRAKFVAADYFKRVPVDAIKAALDELGVSYGDKAKKAELAELAADKATARGWLPVELRHPSYKLRK